MSDRRSTFQRPGSFDQQTYILKGHDLSVVCISETRGARSLPAHANSPTSFVNITKAFRLLDDQSS